MLHGQSTAGLGIVRERLELGVDRMLRGVEAGKDCGCGGQQEVMGGSSAEKRGDSFTFLKR